MRHVFLDRRDGALRLYLHGDLQFDSRDERLYHEALALVPVALAVRRAPHRALRALILGGGDGLALREVLRFPAVREAHVVDVDPSVLRLGAGPLRRLNREAFRDRRTRVHQADARAFLARARDFDVVIYDLTYPGGVAGAALLSLGVFRQARAALARDGIVGVNAVSPEATPQAFGCIGATLGAAGLPAVAYAFLLPSFRDEGYGRWGLFYASPRPVGRGELRQLALPVGSDLTACALLDGLRLPAAATRVMRVAPNWTDELLYYLYNASPLAWEPPWRGLRFGAAPGRPGPRLTAGYGFARWLRGAEGRRTVEELVGCLPLSHQGQTREALLEWSHQAAVLFREVDLRVFVERALQRAAALPRVWTRELRALRDRIRDGLPSMEELLHHAYRVFAIYLLVLLLANLFFPDNVFAKGSSFSSGTRSSSSSGSSTSAPFHGFHFSDPTARPAPYHFRPVGFYAFGGPRSRVYDSEGRTYPGQQVTVPEPGGARKPISALLALSPELQLLESGAVAFSTTLPDYRFLLEPGRLRVLGPAGDEVMSLRPPPALEADTRSRLVAQGPLLDKALDDHRRWLKWTAWGSTLPAGREATAELAELERIRRTVDAAEGPWRAASPGTAVPLGLRWVPIFPGVYLELAPAPQLEPTLVLLRADGQVERRPVAPPATLAAEDRFVFRILQQRLAEGRDPSLAGPVSRWIAAFGPELGATRPPAGPAPRS